MYHYLTNCTRAKGDDIQEMVDSGLEISWRTFWSKVCREEVKMIFPDYDWIGGKVHWLRMKDDYAVRFYRGKYQGVRCYYIVHSAIEYIFAEA